MIQFFSEEELRTWFKQNIDNKFLCYEDDFICAVKMANSDNIATEDVSDDFSSGDWLHLSKPPAQLVFEHHYIPLEKLILDLLLAILCSGGIEVFFGGTVAIPTVCINAINFAIHAGQYFSKLEPAECEFYKYLTSTYYTYSDKLNDLLDFTKSGFPLPEAIDQYCHQRMEQNPSACIDDIKHEAEQSATHFQEIGILSKQENGHFYINF